MLFLTWEFPPLIAGGLGMACYGMVRALLDQGVEVALVLPGDKPCIIEMKRKEHADLLPCRVYDEESGEWYEDLSMGCMEARQRGKCKAAMQVGFSPNPYTSDIASLFRFRKNIEKVIPHVDFDIIHAHDWLTFEAGLYAKGVTGRPLVCHVHSIEYDRACGRGNERIHGFEEIGLALADRVVTVSRFTAAAVHGHYGIHPDRIRVVHNGYFLEESEPSCEKMFNEPVVLFMGRMTCQKGPDIFLEIARRVLSSYPEVRFVMAGHGDMLHNLIHRSAYFGMKNRVLFTGFLNRDEVHRVLCVSDIFVAPSVSDPFNITVLEAMSRGLAVLVSRQSGVTEAVHHVVTADYWNVSGMSRQIVSLLKNPARIRQLSVQGKAEADRVSWDDAAVKLKKLYGELL